MPSSSTWTPAEATNSVRLPSVPARLHMFWTPFTKTDIKPRLAVRDLPEFKDFKLQGAEVAAEKTPWGWTAEFKLPWKNFPDFKAKAGEVIGIECELCSSDGGPRVDRTFVYSGPAAVGSPSAFGRVQLVDKIEPEALKPLGRALLPLALTKSANYDWLYGTVCISPTIEKTRGQARGEDRRRGRQGAEDDDGEPEDAGRRLRAVDRQAGSLTTCRRGRTPWN